MNHKFLLTFLSYFLLGILIIVAFNAVVPEKEIKILRNEKPTLKTIENNLDSDENTVYEILEKKYDTDALERKIEISKNITLKDGKLNLEKGNYKLQFASFKNQIKSNEIANKIKKKFNENNYITRINVKKITIDVNNIFYRVVSNDSYSKKSAEKLCKIISEYFQCLIVKDKS